MESLESALALLMERVHPWSARSMRLYRHCWAGWRRRMWPRPSRCRPSTVRPWMGMPCGGRTLPEPSRDNPVRLQVIGEACAGCGEIFAPGPGQALRVMTGAPVPAACDCVVRQEDTDQGMDTVEIYAAVPAGRNVCRAGEDVHLGDVVLHRGERITAAIWACWPALALPG